MSPGSIEVLRGAYEDNIEDIDLFTGGLAEVPTKGAVVGPTFAGLIGRQVGSYLPSHCFESTFVNIWVEETYPS